MCCVMCIEVEGFIKRYFRIDQRLARHFVKGAYWISSNSSIIFSIAPPLVIALPSCRSYSLLKAIAKSKGKIIAPSRS